MVRILVVVFLLFMVILKSFAQDTTYVRSDSLTEKTTKTSNPKWMNLGIYGQAAKLIAPTPGGLQQNFWIAGGVFFKRWQAGIFLSPYDDGYYEVIIFPNEFSLNYLYGGGYLGYTIYQNKWLDLTTSIALGRGDIIWEITSTFENYFRDEYNMTHLQLEADFARLRFLRPTLSIGYRQMSTIRMPRTNASDFSGFTATIGLRLGAYTKRIIK